MPQSPAKLSLLLTLPPELLQLVTLHFTAAPSNLGPPAALLPLLSVSPAASAPGLGAELAKVGWAKFTSCEEGEGFVLYEGYLWLGLTMVVVLFPYPPMLALLHHYTIPLLPTVHNSMVSDENGCITMPTWTRVLTHYT
ncbi:hypothetical protein B0H14DRAFT_2562667 [Mycena olivaceomarginata]|nr:hypothetical protein B0H14DRAFT_2562667 [Mycena olivaceomarginata]